MFPIFKDTIPCLEKLCSEGFILGILTRSIPEYTKQKLDYHNLNKYFGERIAITSVNAEGKGKDAINLIKKINPSFIDSVYFIGDRVEDVLVEKDVRKKYLLNTEGIWLNREGKSTPEELKKYHQVNSLIEIPKIAGLDGK